MKSNFPSHVSWPSSSSISVRTDWQSNFSWITPTCANWKTAANRDLMRANQEEQRLLDKGDCRLEKLNSLRQTARCAAFHYFFHLPPSPGAPEVQIIVCAIVESSGNVGHSAVVVRMKNEARASLLLRAVIEL